MHKKKEVYNRKTSLFRFGISRNAYSIISFRVIRPDSL